MAFYLIHTNNVVSCCVLKIVNSTLAVVMINSTSLILLRLKLFVCYNVVLKYNLSTIILHKTELNLLILAL